MSYVAAQSRYDDRMVYNRCGRSGLQLPAISLGLWQNFGDDRPLETSRAILRRAFDLGVTHFDLANNYGPPYGSAEENFGADLRARTSRRYRDELVDLDEGGLRHVAGPVRRVGLAQVPAREPRSEPAAHGPRLRGHLLLAPLRPGHAARGDDGRARHGGAAGQGALRGHLVVLGRRRPREAAEILRELGTPLADPPAVVLDAQPLDRGRGPARRARGARGRLHRLLTAGAGHADGQVPRRRPGGIAREPQRRRSPRPAHRARRSPSFVR